jgi:hypothetical protein
MENSRIIRGALGACAVLIASTWAVPAAAQDCGNWPRQVVCQADLILRNASRQTTELDDRDTVELGPGERIELELDARDQRGSRFPEERLALEFDDYRCDAMLNIEDRGEGRLEIEARAAEGRCSLTVWLPNNLNFEWELDIEIRPGARASYDRAEAEFVASALYSGMLGRDADAAGLNGAASEIQRGNLGTQIVAMAGSEEFRQRTATLDAGELLESFYQGILGRPADSGGVRQYLGDMQGRRYINVVLALLRSAEFENRLAQQ